jgi:hypothetical protein
MKLIEIDMHIWKIDACTQVKTFSNFAKYIFFIKYFLKIIYIYIWMPKLIIQNIYIWHKNVEPIIVIQYMNFSF